MKKQVTPLFRASSWQNIKCSHCSIYNENTEKTPDCQHLQFSTHCQFIANTSTKWPWRKMPEKTQYICSILHDHDMTIQWKFTILHQKMRFLTSENIMYGTRWLCFKTDEKKLIRLTWCWKGRCHYWKIGKLPRRQLFFYMLTLKHSWWHRRTSVPSRIYIYIYVYIYVYTVYIWYNSGWVQLGYLPWFQWTLCKLWTMSRFHSVSMQLE